MKQSREEVSFEVESYVSSELQDVEYGDCYPDELRQLMNQLIREIVSGTPEHSLESTVAEIDDIIERLRGEHYEI